MSGPASGKRSGLAALGQPEAVLALVRQGFAGAVGGAFVFLLLEQSTREQELSRELGGDFMQAFALGIVFGGLVTALLVAADEVGSGRWVRTILRTLLAALAGAFIGSFASCVGGFIFAVLIVIARLFENSPVLIILARTVGWGLFGAGAGLSAGLLSRSFRRITQGVWGGLIGGLAGGFLFDILAAFTDSGTLSRFVGFITLGACIGLFTAVAEQLAKLAWLSFLTGAREGRQVLIHRESVVLGRDELADVPLFGDAQVERRHAEIQLEPVPVIREVGQAALMTVGGHPAREAQLYDGAVIQIGRHRLRFHHRQLSAVPPLLSSAPAAQATPGLPASPWEAPAQQLYTAGAPAYPGPAPIWAPPAAPQPYGASPYGAPPPYGGPAPYGAPVPSYPQAPAAQFPDELFAGLSPDATLAVIREGKLVLRLASGPEAGRAIPLDGATVTLGREAGNTVQLTDGKVSRYHARVESLDGAWVLVDLGSTNGTRLNGLAIVRAGLVPGDQIGLGDTLISVEQAGS